MADFSNTAPTPARQPRVSTAAGRYRRWHVSTTAVPEDDIWMMTYLDVFTLMLVMMIVMLAFAGPGKDEASASGAGAAPAAATTTSGPVPLAPSAAPPTGSIVPPLAATHPEPAQPLPPSINGVPIDQLGGDVEVILNSDAVRFRISTELLFESGEAHFAAAGQPVLDKLIPMLNADPTMRLVVEGHTDSVPIRTERFPSNWELSTGRAAAVARYLIERGVAPQRVQASGFADTRPLGSRENPVDRVHNRRVELTMERSPASPTKVR